MDDLVHMLTDPLDSGMDSTGCVMEECLLGNSRVRLPEDLLEDPEIFFSVLSEDTWSEALTDAQRQKLSQLLPQFPENNAAEQEGTVNALFNNQNFCFGNPIHLAQKLFRDGYFNPEVVKYRQLCAKSQRKRQLYSLQQYYHKLLKQILVSRKELLEMAASNGPELAVKRRFTTPSHGEMREERVRHRVGRILREVKNECGDSNLSSDDDELGPWITSPQSPSSPTPTVSLRVVPSLSTQDMKTRDKTELGEKDLKAMLRRHREKRKHQPDHPDLMTSDLHLGDIMSRVNIGKKGSVMDLALPKKRMREEKKKKKVRPVKLESEDACDHLLPSTNSNLEEKVQQWQMSPASTLNPWFSLVPCWSELVVPALHFLAGESKRKTFLWTDYVVRPSTGEERHIFQEQEQQRYDQPHKAFTFRMHGFESVVGPVKGVFDKETSLNKAREHSLLRSDRPPYVTILSLVRDAAARLPNGEGTRAEICELLKDSQFLAPDVTSAQVNTVVSGALDRLHYEKDPCVKYDIGRKLWIYLHRSRSQEEFERIHQAQAAAAKARKALQQKPKPAAKPKTGSKEGSSKNPGCSETGQSGITEPAAVTGGTLPPPPTTPTASTPGTPKSPHPPSTPTKTLFSSSLASCSVLLVSPPSMPQLGTLLTAGQSGSQASQAPVQPGARVVSHPTTTALPQVRVVTAQPGQPNTSGAQSTPTLVHQAPQHIRVPVSMAQGKSITQAVVNLPVRTQAGGSPVQVQTSRGQTTLTVSGLASAVMATKAQSSAPGSPNHTPPSPAILQGVTSQNIIKQVAITGQLGVKTQTGAGIPLTATNLRIQGKDVLRLPPSSITTDAKGQTVLRITPDMMATLTKSPMATVKLTPDMLGSATATAGSKAISATLHVTTTPQPSTPAPTGSAMAEAKTPTAALATAAGATATLVKTARDTAIRLMPALGVTVAEQKARTFTTVTSSPDAKAGTTIRIMPGLGTLGPSGVPVSATVVATQAVRYLFIYLFTLISVFGKLPARITVPLSVLSQPLKSKSVVTTPILKGNISTNIGSLGRNIILTTMPAGTKLIAGNKPVSFVTAQQLQQLQQQGQATQVRIQTVPAQQLQQRTATGSPKSVSAVVVSTAPAPKTAPDPPAPN
uniref:DEUBAD domain-containing protein n=1 Tax=Denticeps clupeoides TaxID=299321 RepID=A0AAY4AAI3_9TELE